MKKYGLRLLPLAFYLGFGFCQTIPFQVGERLEYTAQFNIFPAGTAHLNVIAIDTVHGNPTYHVRFEASTGKFADRIYKIRDKVDTWLDQTHLFTHKQTKKIREGKYRRDSETVFHYRDSVAIINGDTTAVTDSMRDPYSLFYYMRSIPLVLGKTLDFTTFENKVFTDFQVKVTGKEIIPVPAGSFHCLVVKPFRKGKTLLKNQGDMKIWFSDDERRLPVQVQIKLKYGSMILRLKSFSL